MGRGSKAGPKIAPKKGAKPAKPDAASEKDDRHETKMEQPKFLNALKYRANAVGQPEALSLLEAGATILSSTNPCHNVASPSKSLMSFTSI